jgi:hypothetical protein
MSSGPPSPGDSPEGVADFSIKWLIDVESAQIERTALPKACLKVDFLWLRHNRWDEKAGLQRDALSSQLSTRLKRGRQGDRR